MSNVMKAIEFGKEKHKGQKRWGGEDYFENHCMVVAHYVRDNYTDLIPDGYKSMWGNTNLYHCVFCAALLHDTIEDTDTTYEELSKEFGYLVADIVEALTRKYSKSYCDYIKSIFDCGSIFVPVRAIKTADLRCNLKDLKKGSVRDKYELALELLWK